MIATIGVIGFLVLVLIYFVVKTQTLQRQLNGYRSQAKAAGTKAKFALSTLDGLASEIKKHMLNQLESAKRRNLIAGEDYERTFAIFSGFEYVVMLCCDHNATVEEALKKSLERSPVSFEDVTQYIAKQPNEVKLPWSKNHVGSYVAACHNIAALLHNPKSSSSEKSEAS